MKRKFKLLAAALAAITAMSCASATAFAEQKTVYGEEYVKAAVDYYSGMDWDDPYEREAFDDLTALSGGRLTYYFNDELLHIQNMGNKLIKISCTIEPGLEERDADFYEWLKNDFDFCFFTNDYKEYYYSFDITERSVFTLKEVVEKSGVDTENIAIAMLKCPPGDMDYTLESVETIDCKKGWYTLNGERYYVKKDGMLATGLYCIGGTEYKFDKNCVCKGKYTGWAKTSKGKLYYKNGVKVTKNTTIGGVRYKFSSDGYCKGKFTGFTKSSQGRKYWSKGILTKDKWVQDPKGNYYYAGSDGYLLTGWQKVTRIGGTYSYFDENGVWDGKIHKNGYVRNDLRSVFKDYDFFAGEKYYYNFNNHSADKMKPLDGVDVLREIIEKDLDTPLLWADFDDDEIEPPDELYYGGRKIVIRSSVSNNIDFEITRDNDGNSYLYNAYFGFGLKLTDSDAYDKIMVLLTFQG